MSLPLVVQIPGSDAPVAAQEILQPAVSAVDRLNVQFTTDTFLGGLVETFMADAHFCGAGWVPAAAISHQESVPIKTWLQNRFEMFGCQHTTEARVFLFLWRLYMGVFRRKFFDPLFASSNRSSETCSENPRVGGSIPPPGTT